MNKILSDFEKKQNIKLPTSYKSLLINFNLNDLTLHYLNEKENFKFRLTKYLKWTKDNLEVYVDTFIERDELLDHWTKYFEIYRLKDFLPIGYTSNPVHETLLLNLQPDKLGEIWIQCLNDKRVFNLDYLDKDILTFIDHCDIVKTENFEIIKSKLYKRMDEDFWRLK
jgi:hypothetical protein